MRRRVLTDGKVLKGLIRKEGFCLAGDVVFYDRQNDKLFVVDLTTPSENLDIKHIVPIGVIAVPSTHNIYGTGEAAAISLVNMSLSDGTDGLVTGNLHLVPGLSFHQYVVVTGNLDTGPTEEMTGYAAKVFFPTDTNINRLRWQGNPYDEKTTGWWSGPFVPSPYKNDGSFNEVYFSDLKVATWNVNATLDVDGKENTRKIIEYRGERDYNTWSPSNVLEDYPAASTCDMFYTPGTSQGDWYLPGMGELGYISVRQTVINNTLRLLSDWFKKETFTIINHILNSSTKYSDLYPRGLNCTFVQDYDNTGNSGNGAWNIKNANRAFLRISPEAFSPDKFVDMGLSVKWATCNIGATKPEEYGYYFQWGGIIPYNSDRTPVDGGDAISFNWTNYPLCNGSSSTMTKYCTNSSYGTVDNKTILEPQDDAACVHIGGECRMPTNEEFQELINACNTTWVTNYNGTGINGRLFTLKTDPSKTLFFPAAGGLSSTSWGGAGSTGYYWSGSLSSSTSYYGRYLLFNSVYCGMDAENRLSGRPIRAVLP